MRVVWKQPLKLTEKRQEFLVKGFEKVVHVALQYPSEDITVWYLADSESTYHETVAFQIFGTGDQVIPDGAKHRGTVQQGWEVWHVFEVKVPEYVCSQEPHPGMEFYGENGGCAECGYRP